MIHRVLVCIDLDYPPQVQYLMPFKEELEERGYTVAVTARDIGATHQLLEAREVAFTGVGTRYGTKKWQKATGTLGRARRLAAHWRRTGVPEFVIATGRAATVASRLIGRPSFAVIDYEHVNFTVQRLTRPVVFFPESIGKEAFMERGLREDRLVAFPGLKEDISFAGVDIDAVPTHEFPNLPARLIKVLVRPPTEESHYFKSASRDLTLAALEYLSEREDVVVILSARHSWQVADLARTTWRTDPVVLERPVPFISLLKSVDAVFAAGGTMVREAAYLGVPTWSLFQGPTGGVDAYLASIGRITMIEQPADFERLELRKRGPLSSLRTRPGLVGELVDEMLARVPRPD